ncbi:MAG: lysine--tRNA ligase, partial [Candidatus Paceibacterota bacterium]
MFWADKLVEEIKIKYKDKIDSKKPLIIRDEKTASGRIHVGSLRGVAIHGIISEVLSEQKINNKFLYEINDFDPMDDLPAYLDVEKFSPFIGKPLYSIPSPDNKAKNYAEYFAQEFINVIKKLGFDAEYYRSSDSYKSGKYNEVIELALENADKIRDIYKHISGAIKENNWLPLQVVCEKCGKIGTTKVISFDGEKVEYICEKNLVEWAKGCGHSNKISPFNGNAKLPWKVEWAAKFKIFNVDIEGAGKDHSTKGGSREIADAICREVFKYEPPFNIPYEFFHIAGKKMSTSKGAGLSSKEIVDLLPTELIRLLLINKEPKRVIDFIPDGDTIPVLYDEYDRIAEHYFSEAGDDYSRIFTLVHKPEDRMKIQKRFLPRFSQVAFLAQMSHMDIDS